MAEQINNPPSQELEDIACFVIKRSTAGIVVKRSDAGFVLKDEDN